MTKSSKTLFIGMPTYNEERYIKSAIESLQKQTYSNWVLFVSDNNSSDSTSEICASLAENDQRIVHFRHKENIGLIANFNFVYDEYINKMEYEYFMWAQSDDIWEPLFLETCVTLLESNKDIGVSFTAMDNIDSFGEVIRQYPSFNRFTANNKFLNKLNYLLEPELIGKCNMFLGVYKRNIIKNIMTNSRFAKWYSDYVIAFGIVSLGRLAVDDRILYHKRDDKFDDEEGFPKPVIIMSLRNGVFGLKKLIPLYLYYTKHEDNILKKIVVMLIMLLRIPRSLYATIYKYINYFRYSNIYKFKRLFFNYYGIKFLKQFDFKKGKREKIDIGYGYAYTSSEITLNLDQLHIKLKGDSNKKNYQINETPHYSFVSGIFNTTKSILKKEDYINYKKNEFPENNISKQVNSFEKLALNMKKDFESNSLEAYILVENNMLLSSNNYKTSVIDGTHRLAVLAGLGVEKVVCKFVDKIENYND